jgi:ATP-dependent exoDNAse (exonuclease V) beta subunit
LEVESFKIFRSSAGSGKTYRLALEYLKLALKDPGYYRRILAVTFTNKATNEMKERIIQFLFKIAKDEAEVTLIDTLCKELHCDALQLKSKANNTLLKLLHGYSYFSVSTIDSFFQKIISAFSRDLGIQGGYRLEFDIEQVKAELIDRLFIGLEENNDLRKWLVQFAMSKIESNKSWDIRYDINQLAGQIFNESFSVYYNAIGEKISDTKALSVILKDISKKREQINDKYAQLGNQGLNIIQDAGLEPADFSRGLNGPAGFFIRMSCNQPVNLKNTYLNNALHSVEAWFTKKSKKQEAITNVLQNGLLDFYRETFNHYKNETIKDNTYYEVQKYFYNLGLLSYLLEGLKSYREENEVVLISDLSHLLKVVIGENDAPFIYEKVGNFYHHFLIDEFQDTSRFQWYNFLPLVLNGLSSGMFSMIVGDVKQSIYRWRGGDWEILQNQVVKDLGPHYVVNETLKENWRSLRKIVDFNNTLFKSLAGLFKTKFIEEISEVYGPELQSRALGYSHRFEDAYQDVQQKLPENKKYRYDGMVEIKFLDGSAETSEKTTWSDEVLPEIIARIKALQDYGYAPKDIAILVRRKEEGKKVANYLLDYKNNMDFDPKYKFDVISSESLFLKASPAVHVIINFIKLVLNQDDLIALANFYYWISILKSGPSDLDHTSLFRKLLHPDTQMDLNATLLNIQGQIEFNRFRSFPLIDLIEEITLLLRLSEHPAEGAYLLGMHNAILEFLENHHNDLHTFIEWWSEEGETKSIKPSLEQNAINILTIHQSKGLQYKNVLIPFCSWNVDHSTNKDNIIWAGSSLPILDQVPYYPLRYSRNLGESYFIDQYFEEKSMAYMDNLNLLYVAMTRAEEGLFVFTELPPKTDRSKTVGDVLLQFFNQGQIGKNEKIYSESLQMRHFWNEETHTFRMGQIVKQEPGQDDAALYALEPYDTGTWHNKISIRRQADILSHEGMIDTGEKINYGILLHDILSKVYRKDQLQSVLEAEENAGNITSKDKDRLSHMMQELWNLEKVNDWFTGGWEIKTEVPVLPMKGHLSRLDRVMIKDNMAIVVDYKSGARRHSDTDQVKNYMNILDQMGYDRVEGYVLYLTNKELIKV